MVDWSDLDPRKQHFLLRAAVAVKGRSLTLFEKIYPLSQKEKPTVHADFMTTLKSMLPATCKPIIVSDAGFRVPWFKLIKSLGWDFVGRVRNRTFCKNNTDENWHSIKDLYTQASTIETNLGCYQLCRNAPISCQLVIYKGAEKGRHHFVATGDKPRQGKPSRVHAEREKEPWLLETSLSLKEANLAKKVVRIYHTRMQIEESFRDLKTGLNFSKSQSRTRSYLSVLLLLAMLAQYVLYLLGIAVELTQQHLCYQASSIKAKAVLSYQFIGLRAFKDRYLKLRKRDWQAAGLKIQALMREPLNV